MKKYKKGITNEYNMDKKKKQLESFILRNNVPNLLFYGPYMNGKEQLCRSFIQSLYIHQEDIAKYVLWLNCLSTNGIQTMKELIKLFSMQIIQKKSGVFFKTIVLQYAEYLTYDSQYSLRRTIEQYNQNTRFILLCEKKHKMLQPICSRFVHYYVNESQPCYKLVDAFPYSKFNKHWKAFETESNRTIDVFHIAKRMYDDHLFAHEIVMKMKKHPIFPILHLLFETYSVLFRNELLCIFSILCVFRSKSKIQILGL
tara:strand:+ start:6225 stop:6992 length:768 start_codon:yes stop_codon:yes gene_type:complete